MPDTGPPGLWRTTLPVQPDMTDEEVLVPAFVQSAINCAINCAINAPGLR